VAAADTGIVGLDFDALGRLFDVTRHSPGLGQPRNAGELIEVDPLTGASLGSIAIIMDGSTPIPINDLAFQPRTGFLFGAATGGGDAPCASCLHAIDLTTAQATFVGEPSQSNAAWNKSGGLAFEPDGTLYGTTTVTNPVLAVLDPTDGSVLSLESVVVAPPANTGYGGFFGGLALRPEDGLLFATHGVASLEIFMRNPTTTQWERIGAPRPALSDRAFLATPRARRRAAAGDRDDDAGNEAPPASLRAHRRSGPTRRASCCARRPASIRIFRSRKKSTCSWSRGALRGDGSG